MQLIAHGGFVYIEWGKPANVSRGRHDLHPFRHRVIVIVHDLKKIKIVCFEKLEMDLGGPFGRGMLVAEMIPDGKRRTVHRLSF